MVEHECFCGCDHEHEILVASASGAVVDLIRVAKHEIGHSMGLLHAPEEERKALMAPFISNTRAPCRWDIATARQLYGENPTEKTGVNI